MSRYLVSVRPLDGVQRFLMLGRLTERRENATRYPHPSNARQAERSFRKRSPVYLCATSIIDTRTGEELHPQERFAADRGKT